MLFQSNFILVLAANDSLGATPTIVMCAYIFLLLGLGIYGYLKSQATEDDYYLAGRGQSLFVTTLTIMATFFSSAALLGFPGLIYKDGIAFFFFALNLPLSGAAVYVLGSRITRIGRARGYVTPADMLADYYEGSSVLRILIALTGFLYVVPYVIVQVRAGGHLAAQLFPDIEPVAIGAMTFSVFDFGASSLAILMTVYVLLGGMRSVALADSIQGTLLLLGMLVSGAAIVFAFGGIGEYFKAVSSLPPEALSVPGVTGRWTPWLLLTLCVFASLGTMIQPAQWMRYYAAQSTETLKGTAVLFSTLLPICFLFGVFLVGLGARALYPPTVVESDGHTQVIAHETVGDPDQSLVAVLRVYGPQMFGTVGPLIVSLILMAVLAASMSTADSNLHALSAVITRDIYDRFIRPGASNAEKAWVGRIVIIIAAGLSLWLVHVGQHQAEFSPLRLIGEMMIVAIAFSTQLLPLAIDAIFLHRGTRIGAIFGLSAGLLTVLCFTPLPQMFLNESLSNSLVEQTTHLKRLVDIGCIGCCVNVVVFSVISCITKRLDAERVEEFAQLMKSD